jgi:hypothetical protein
MNNKTYNYKDLIKAYISAKRYQNASPELRDYYAGLYSCLSSFFGIDLHEIEQNANLKSQYCGLDSLFHKALDRYLGISSPFSDFLEAPRNICDLHDTYGIKLSELEDKYKGVCFGLMCEIHRIIFGATDKQITSDELKKLGFDDSQEPDELDFF